jgi:hypothetical protein
MPLLSRRRRAVDAISRCRGAKFQSKVAEVINLEDDQGDEYFDIDDDRLENLVDVGEDIEIDTLEDATKEIVLPPRPEFIAKLKSWREDGNNSGVRDAGTSYRTFKRNKRKFKDIQSSAGFLVTVQPTQSASIVAAPNEIVPSPNEMVPAHPPEIIEDDHIFGILDPYDIFGDEEMGDNASQIPKFTMKEAITNILLVEAKVTRNRRDERKSLLQTYQRVQGLALLRYFQLVLDGNLKMVASAKAALCLYNKRGIWSYKARSIRSWGEHYLKKGISNNSNTLSNSSRNSLSTLYLIGELVMFRQGLHYKTSSIINDEHVQALFLTELRAMKDEHRTPETFKTLCNETLFQNIPNAPSSITLSTSESWMKYLGYIAKIPQKGYYTDGHNRDDIVDYSTRNSCKSTLVKIWKL